MPKAIICGCIDGVVAIRNDGYFSVNASMEQAAKSYEDVCFVRFSDVTAAMLAQLGESRFLQEVLLCLGWGGPDCPRYSYTQLLAMELVQKLDILQSVGRIARDWRMDIVPVMDELTRITETGILYPTE